MRARVPLVGSVLAVLLISIGGCKSITADYYVPDSFEAYVAKTPIIVVGTVSEIGPVFNSCRAGERGELGPDPDLYCFSRIYVVKVERYLKGSGPDMLRTADSEGHQPGVVDPAAAVMRAISGSDRNAQLIVGSRYLFFFYHPHKLPELGDLEVMSGGGTPGKYLLSPDGSATPHGPGVRPENSEPSDDVWLKFPRTTESELVARIERLIAAQPTP